MPYTVYAGFGTHCDSGWIYTQLAIPNLHAWTAKCEFEKAQVVQMAEKSTVLFSKLHIIAGMHKPGVSSPVIDISTNLCTGDLCIYSGKVSHSYSIDISSPVLLGDSWNE